MYIRVGDVIQHVEHEDKATEVEGESARRVDLVLMCILLLQCNTFSINSE